MKELYGIDMEKDQYSKLISDIPNPDIAISMGCNVGCPFIGRAFDDNWGLDDPTGKSDEKFIAIKRRFMSVMDSINASSVMGDIDPKMLDYLSDLLNAALE